MSQSDTETLYSLPTKQARGRENISSTYDTFVPNQPPGLEQLIELQEKVKSGSLSMDEALERFSDWQRVQKGMDAIQQWAKFLLTDVNNNRIQDWNYWLFPKWACLSLKVSLFVLSYIKLACL
ncbi:unnamed protein product [Coregonus sp. 'balchen']|nr:unnamed protein product [Coregonus sp. 'balchen']